MTLHSVYLRRKHTLRINHPFPLIIPYPPIPLGGHHSLPPPIPNGAGPLCRRVIRWGDDQFRVEDKQGGFIYLLIGGFRV